MYKIYFVELDETLDELIIAKLLSFVSSEKQQRVQNIKFPINRKLTLYSEMLVRVLVCNMFEVKNNQLSFITNEYGKPQLAGFPNFHFNISHTRNAMVVAIGEKPVGVDVEQVKKADLNIAPRFFTEQENTFILDKVSNQDKRFYEIWTIKEAYIKYRVLTRTEENL